MARSLVGLARLELAETASVVGVGIGGASSSLGGGVLPFSPNERALLAREVKDGGCANGYGAAAGLAAENMGAVEPLLTGNRSSSSGSRSGSRDEGRVDVEL